MERRAVQRIDLAATRAMVTAALSGKLNSVETKRDSIFGLPIPVAVPGVDSSLLDPAKTWKDAAAYRAKAQHLSDLFIKNFAKFPDAPEEVKSAGPLEHQPA